MTEAKKVDAERMDASAATDSERIDDARAGGLTVDEPDETRADRSTMDTEPDEARTAAMHTNRPGAPAGTGSAIPMPSGDQHTATMTPAAGMHGDTHRYDEDWRAVQAGFVDDPAGAVRDADALVGRLIDEVTRRRAALSERDTGSGEQTEQLRQALREYRTLYQRLVPAERP